MRAIYQADLKSLKNECWLKEDDFHHLKNVLRIKVGDEVLFLDGAGYSRGAIVEIIEKKMLKCSFVSDLTFKKSNSSFSIALALAKRESLESSLKQLVEIGVTEIFLFDCAYSNKIELKQDRLNKLLISALEQSNGQYLPTIKKISFQQLLEMNVDKFIYFSSVASSGSLSLEPGGSFLLIIGPEGGLSEDEEESIKNLKNSVTINLPTNILRASTASSVCSGYILGKIAK